MRLKRLFKTSVANQSWLKPQAAAPFIGHNYFPVIIYNIITGH